MRTNPVKRQLRAGQPSFGTWLTLGDLHASRLLARSGFDWLTLDMEHAPIDWREAAAIFAAVADAGCVPLARVPEGTHFFIKRALDAGAWGVVVPMVDTVEQAEIAIRAAKYPPQGNRSTGGGMHSLNFAAEPGEYYARANDEILVILQTESPAGIANADAIYALADFDAVFVGPMDLRAFMRSPDGCPPTDTEHEAAIQEVIRIGRQHGKPTGIHAMDADDALCRSSQGAQFIAVASDLRMLYLESQAMIAKIHPERAGPELAKY